jgi:hypothetical protein
MSHPWPRRVLIALLPLSLGGCSSLMGAGGSLLGGAGSLLGGILEIAVYLAAIAAPILLTYYLYHRHII